MNAFNLATAYRQEVVTMLRSQAVQAEKRLFEIQTQQSDLAQKMLQHMKQINYAEDNEWQLMNKRFREYARNLEMQRILLNHAWVMHRKAEAELLTELLDEYQQDKFGELFRNQ